MVQDIGGRISRFYYKYCMYRSAFFYANRVYELWGDETESQIINRLGLIYDVYGNYESALKFYLKDLEGCRKSKDKAGEGTTLNNISQIYDSRGDYETALSYLEQSLKIRREIGDKAGSATTLHNIAIIAYTKDDIEKFLEYETAAYRIATEINDAMLVYSVGRDLGNVLCKLGQEEEGIEMLKRSLAIGKAAGFPDVGEVEEMLKEFGS
jgi:tetratricopeptide (TPR) repeat protein